MLGESSTSNPAANPAALDLTAVSDLVDRAWSDDIVERLTSYIAIPALSPAFDPDWGSRGYLASAIELVRSWCAVRPIAGMTVSVQQLPSHTPLIVIDIAAHNCTAPGTALVYGHLDKQPEMTGWRDGLGPWTPVLDGDRLYGRGGADDGYSAFAALTAIEACQRSGGSHRRLVVLIEASEESGSCDLPAHLDALGDRLGDVSLVMCLDSGCHDYERLWTTTSLRGLVGMTLTVQVLTEGVHSGSGSGIVPSSFRIIRQLLDRVENSRTAMVLIPEMHVAIPRHRMNEARDLAAMIGAPVSALPTAGATRPVTDDPTEQLLNSTWRPTLSIIAADGLPAIGKGGNVLRPSTSLALSFRIPPGVDPDRAIASVERILTDDPPYAAQVSISHAEGASGWDAPATAPWLADTLDRSSRAWFGSPASTLGEGGSIPFMAMLGRRFPNAQFVITGVLGPDSNAHGPNEYLHVPTATKLTKVMAEVLDAHARTIDTNRPR